MDFKLMPQNSAQSHNDEKKQEVTSQNRASKRFNAYATFIYEQKLFVLSGLAFVFTVHSYFLADNYIKQFNGVNLFHYGSFIDIYQVAWGLNSGRMYAALLFLFVYLVISVIAFIPSEKQTTKFKRITKLIVGFLIISIMASFVYAGVNEISHSPKRLSSAIIEGRTPLYNIELGTGKKIQCVALIAGTSSYLFIWHFGAIPHFEAVAKGTGVNIEQVIKAFPTIKSISGSADILDSETKKDSISQAISQWKTEIRKQCGEIKIDIDHL